jgi:hypothetical protein
MRPFTDLTDADKIRMAQNAIDTQRPISWRLAKWLLERSTPDEPPNEER